MKKIETQIRHLKKEIEEIDENVKWGKEHTRKRIGEIQNQISVLKRVKKRYLKLFKLYRPLINKSDVLFDEKWRIKEEINSRRYFFTKSMSEIEFSKEIQERGDKIHKEMRTLDEEAKKLINEIYAVKFYGIGRKIDFYMGEDEIKKIFDDEIKKLEDSVNRMILSLDNTDKGEDYNNKKEKIEKLERKLAKQKKQRSLANAYLKKNRLDASTVKSRLKDLSICPYCGNEADELEADHIYPVSSGGLSIAENMVNVCKPCNRNKGHLTLRQFIKRYDLDRDYIENRLDELGKRF